MSLAKQLFICSSSILLLLLAGTPNWFSVAAKAQTSDESSDATIAEQSDGEELDGEQHIENPIKEGAQERTLELEYNEHSIDWHSWAEKVAGAVWNPLIENGAVACGRSRVRWQVTSDCRVHIISVYTPIPDGAQVLIGAIKALDHNSILAFPPGSTKTVVWRIAQVGGQPVMHRIHGPIKVYP